MITLYQKKNYTQGFLREKIRDNKIKWKTYKQTREELWIWSDRTIAKWILSETIESKSSAPINPYYKRWFTELIKLYCVRKYMKFNIDDSVDYLLENYWINLPRSTAWYWNKERWLSKVLKEKNGKFKEYDPWYLHIDITYWPKINWKKYYIFVAIDRATRLMYLEIYEDKTAKSAELFLRKALERYPFKIEKILTDNWKEFTSKNHKWKYDLIWLFDEVCTEFDIEHRLTKPMTPKTNWMVEKCNDTIKSNTVKIHDYDSIDIMKKDLNWFMIYYNLQRKHWWLVKERKGKTPLDAIKYYYKIMPEIFTTTPTEFENNMKEFAKKQSITMYTKRV